MTDSTTEERGGNVVLIGFMGCGKSTIGKRVAASIGFDFVDTDEIVEKACGSSIPVIFENEGEPGFRKHESDALRSLASEGCHVIATGGGIITQTQNLPLLKQLGLVVWLTASEEVIYHRVSKNDDRPLLQTSNPRETIHQLFMARHPQYAQAADIEIDTSGLSIEETAYGLSQSILHYFSGSAPDASK